MKNTNNIILITGGATGIGFSLAERLIAKGNTVIACGRSETSLELAQKKLPSLITRICDVTDSIERQKLVVWLTEHYPELNVLINNAGIQYRHDFSLGNADGNQILTEIQTNLIAPILLVTDLLPLLKKQSVATIVNVTSGLAFCPLASIPVYCATKAALHSFTLSLRHQLANSSVRVVEIVPPMIDKTVGGQAREIRQDGPPMVTLDQFADDAFPRLLSGEQEIVVGIANGARSQGEKMFGILNK